MPLTDGLQLPFGIQPVNPIPVNTWEGPYNSFAEALITIPIGVRYPTMEVSILDSITGNKKYWFKDGITDNDLILFGIDASFLTGETQDRIDADINLQDQITGLTEEVDDNYYVLNQLITGETATRINQNDAINDEITGLTSSINDEVSNRISGDTINYSLITGETSNRINSDINLQNQITGETQNRIFGDTTLENKITGLTTTVGSNYNILANQVTGETSNRINQDNILQNQITGLTATIEINYNTLGDLITGETSRSEGVETGLTASINNETFNRITGDTTNYNMITGETANRIIGDVNLQNEITDLTATFTTGIEGLNSGKENVGVAAGLVGTETSRAEGVEGGKANKTTQIAGVVLLAVNWVLNASVYEYIYNNILITSDSYVDVIATVNGNLAVTAGVSPLTSAYADNLVLYANSRPTGDITVTLIIYQ